MAQGDAYFDNCDSKKALTVDQVIKDMVVQDENGNPVLKAPYKGEPVKGNYNNNVDTNAHTLIAGDAEKSINITAITVTNKHASDGAIVDIIEETSGDILWTNYAGPEGGGFTASIPDGIKQLTKGKDIQVKARTAADIDTSVAGFKN